MKKFSLIISVLALVMGLSQCQKRPNAPVYGSGEKVKQNVTITASYGDNESKVNVVETAAGILDLTWAETDCILVYEGIDKVGELSYVSGAGTKDATFTGCIEATIGNELKFCVGTMPEIENQDGTFEWIKGNCYLEGSDVCDKDANYNVSMEVPYAILKIDLSALGTESGCSVTFKGGDITLTKENVFKNTPYVVYMALPKSNGKADYTFTGDEHTVIRSWNIESNVYYTQSGDDAQPTGNPIDLNFTYSVSDSKKVEFAPGNLYWNGSEFKFEEKQWDYANALGDYHVIEENYDYYDWKDNHIMHFFWSNDYEKSIALEYSDGGAADTDILFTNRQEIGHEDEPNPDFEVNGMAGVYRTLTKAEMCYFTGVSSKAVANSEYRDNSANLREWVTLDGINGYVFLPDSFSENAFEYIKNLEDLDRYGAIFMPASSYRYRNQIAYFGTRGHYHTCTPVGKSDCYNLCFSSTGINGEDVNMRSFGFAIRMVKDVK